MDPVMLPKFLKALSLAQMVPYLSEVPKYTLREEWTPILDLHRVLQETRQNKSPSFVNKHAAAKIESRSLRSVERVDSLVPIAAGRHQRETQTLLVLCEKTGRRLTTATGKINTITSRLEEAAELLDPNMKDDNEA